MDAHSLFSSIDLTIANLVGGALLVVLSFLANGQLNRMADRRAAKIRFVEEQLKSLYGPLYAISRSNETVYRQFNTEHADIVANVLGDDLSSDHEQSLSVWNASVFQPSNLGMRGIIERNAHLFTTATMPESFFSLVMLSSARRPF